MAADLIESAVTGIGDRLKDVGDVPLWSMSPAATRQVLSDVVAVKAQLAELEARILQHGQTLEIHKDSGATSIAAWWAHQTRQTRAAAHRIAKLATALAKPVHEPVRLALADGVLLPDQAEVVLEAVRALPEDLDPDIVAQAQARLLGYAGEYDARHLHALGRKILEVVAPEIGEAHEAELLEKEERDAAAAARWWGRRDGHGKVRFGGVLPEAHWDILHKAVLAYAAPRHRAAVDGKAPGRERPSDHRLGEGFMELIEALDGDRLPCSGGVNATVVVLMDYDTLLGGLKAAQLDTGTWISPGLARRLACAAGIIPAVLGGKSQVLDLGRKRRFHTRAQRLALLIEQGGCTAQGCDRPAWMTHAPQRQRQDPPTDVSRGRR